MKARCYIWARKRPNRDNIFEVWMEKKTAKWLEDIPGVSVVREGSLKNQYAVFIDPRYGEEDFEKLVEFFNLETGLVH